MPRPLRSSETFRPLSERDTDSARIIMLSAPLKLTTSFRTLFRVANDLYAIGPEMLLESSRSRPGAREITTTAESGRLLRESRSRCMAGILAAFYGRNRRNNLRRCLLASVLIFF